MRTSKKTKWLDFEKGRKVTEEKKNKKNKKNEREKKKGMGKCRRTRNG